MIPVFDREARHNDIPAIVALEQDAFAEPMDAEEWVAFIRDRRCIAKVLQAHDILVGVACFSLNPDFTSVVLHRLVVMSGVRRRGFGRQLVEAAESHARLTQVYCVEAVLEEANLIGHQFLRACGYTGQVQRDYFEDGRAAYVFRKRLPECTELPEG